MSGYIAETCRIVNSSYGEDLKLFRNVALSDSVIEDGVSIGDDTTVERCHIGKHVAINRRSYINDSYIGDYSYTGINTTMNYTRMGKFCSIARNVDIGGFDHDYHKITTMPMFRFRQMQSGSKPITRHDELCEIGNDVWIAAGAQVLHKVKIGDGAVVGGGAVVTKDVPPYAIVAGTPAKIINYRFDEEYIKELLNIRWWDWPDETILKNMVWLTELNVTDDSIARMKTISKSIRG